jgi:hypothetical protein
VTGPGGHEDPPGASPDAPGDDAGTLVRADLLTGIVLFVLGALVVWWSWEMPRLEERRIHPITAPGLVPGMLGLALAFCGAVLAAPALRVLPDARGWRRFGALFVSPEAARVAVTAALALVFPLGLIGRMPFWAASALFVFLFIVVFERGFGGSPHPWWRTLLTAALQAALVGGLVTVVFQYGFLVRLP